MSEVKRARLQRTLIAAQERMQRLDEQIGRLMSRRVDCEDHQAEILAELEKMT